MPIFAVGQSEEGRTLMLGLSTKDLTNLMTGEVIEGNLEQATGIKGLKMILFYGETDESIRTEIDGAVPTMRLASDATAEDLNRILQEDMEKLKGDKT